MRILVSEELLEKLAKGKVKYVRNGKIKLGRWKLKKKIGEFVGCKSETKD